MNKSVITSLYISFIYVGLGTLLMYLSLSYDSVPLLIGLLLTLPATVLSFGIVFTEAEPFWWVAICQVLTFFLYWFTLNTIMKRRKNK